MGAAALGARRLAAATAYTDEVNARLRQFLEEAGSAVLELQGMDIEDPSEAERVTQEHTAELALRVYRKAARAHCLVISRGGLKTLDIIPPLEAEGGVPVVTCYTATLWGLARPAGTRSYPGFGQLLDREWHLP